MTSPFEHAKRRSMTPQRRARIFAAHDERCHKCTRKIRPGEDWDVDHVLALERGGTDDDDNLAPICEWCHTDKTADDHATAGHMRRGYTKHNVPGRFRKAKGWRT
jgi:5-methylcytosine-specific restriction enzyme A